MSPSKFAWFSGESGYDKLLTTAIVASAFSLYNSKYQKRAPYGRFGQESKHLSLDPRLGWWLMELPATLCFLYGFRRGLQNLKGDGKSPVKIESKEENAKRTRKVGVSKRMQVFFFLFWARHYLNRGWYFPLTIRVAEGGKASFALFNSLIGAVIVGTHGYLNGRLFSDVGQYKASWMRDPRFLLGWAIAESGFWTLVSSESILRNLRPAGSVVSAENRYKIPYGGMFEYVTSPQYLGEIMAWGGFLMMTWSPTAIPVFLITLANLVPRAFENQKWYQKNFPNYPPDRKALLPFFA